MLKQIIGILAALSLALPLQAGTQVVCSVVPASQVSCNEITVSEAAQKDTCACSMGTESTTPASSLLTGLVHYWKLDETSGTRADSVGGATLSDNNTVLYAAGIHDNAATFVVVNNEWLSLASPSITADLAGDFTVSTWFNPTTFTDRNTLINMPGMVLDLKLSGTQRIQWYFTNVSTPVVLSNSAINLTAWNCVTLTWTASTRLMTIQLNGDTVATQTAAVDRPTANAATLIGLLGSGTRRFDGSIDEVGVWNRVLTDAERLTLYNSGAGKFYPNF